MTVAVFTFVLLLANVLKEILALLVTRHISLLLAVEAIALLIPFVLVFALPMGMLTAALLVFGRFSADNELTAARASGISLVALISPILLMSVVFSGVCGVVNLHVAPNCRLAYKRLLFEFGAQAGLFIQEKTFIKDFPDRIVYAGEVDGLELRDIVIYNLNDDKVESYIRASEGRFDVDRGRQIVRVHLFDAWSVSVKDVEIQGEARPVEVHFEQIDYAFTNNPTSGKRERLRLTDMTFLQLRSQLQELERQLRRSEALPKHARPEAKERARRIESKQEDLTLPIRVQIHRQVAFSFACIGFTLVGVPLGIRAHRRETTFGIAVALLLVLAYYGFFIFAEAMDTRPEWMPHLVLWMPNFLFQAVGGVLLWRANRGV